MQTYAQDISDALQLYGHCLLPGLGLLTLERKPAERSYPHHQLSPPSFSVQWQPLPVPKHPYYSIVQQIAYAYVLKAEEAAAAWESAEAQILQKLSSGSSVTLAGLGLLNLDEDRKVTFIPWDASLSLYPALALNPENKPVRKEPVASEPVISEAQSPVPELLENSPPPSESRQARSKWWVIGSIIALLAVGWFTYKGTLQRRKAASNFNEIVAKDSPGQASVHDTTVVPGAAASEGLATEKPDSLHYVIVFADYDNEDRARRQFNRMRNWGHPVVLLTRDSMHYGLGLPFTSMPADTTVNLVKIMKLYGPHAHIVYVHKQ